ncbi:hypothetical protein M422DRAFT_168444, partial [Sphaerobolus stellatus SS14]
YPDVLPNISLRILEGTIEDKEHEDLMAELQAIGEENLGMAMTFTIVSHLQEKLPKLLHAKLQKRQEEEQEQERIELEAEEARTRGTPVTPESFLAWKARFDKEMAKKKAAEWDERFKMLPAKEREEQRKVATRLSGRQLFEKDRNLATSDATLIEEGVESIDISQFDRTAREEEEEEAQGLQFSDSDSD